jgi:hypothetical protein
MFNSVDLEGSQVANGSEVEQLGLEREEGLSAGEPDDSEDEDYEMCEWRGLAGGFVGLGGAELIASCEDSCWRGGIG